MRSRCMSDMFSLNEEYVKDENKRLSFENTLPVHEKVARPRFTREPLKSEKMNLAYFTFFCLVAANVCLVCGLGNFSGRNQPPLFGDFEAQRHWMEVTYNLPPADWYRNTSENDLLYWGLDYPPLTAYHSYAMGYLAAKVNPAWIRLYSSRGIEELAHKVFMRATAFVSHATVFFPAVWLFLSTQGNLPRVSKTVQSFLILLYPGLISVDHGHFQYNSISLGFFIASYSFLVQSRLFSGSVFFVLALNYKQMELYHSLPIFVYILGRCLRQPLLHNSLDNLIRLFQVSLTVILTFGALWAPFVLWGSFDYLPIILGRIFPFYRGLFEDKVGSFWCASSWLIKWNRLLTTEQLIKLSTGLVLTVSSPALFFLFRRTSSRNFRIVLFAVSLCFFLFSFQVHEKSILLPASAAFLLLGDEPELAATFLHVSNTSLFSLCVKDGNEWHLTLFVFYALSLFLLLPLRPSSLLFLRFLIPLLACLAELLLLPPPSLPHIFPLLSAVVSCSSFILDLFNTYIIIFRESTSFLTNDKKCKAQ